MAQGIPVFLGGDQIVPADIQRIEIGVITKAARDDVRVAILIDRGDPAQALAFKVFNFLGGETAHGIA